MSVSRGVGLLASLFISTAPIVHGLPVDNAQSLAPERKPDLGQGFSLRLPPILKRDDAAQPWCDRTCVYRLLYQTVYSATSSGIEYGMATYKTQDFCFKQETAWCPQLVDSSTTAIASRSSYMSIDYDACDSACLLLAMNEVSRRGAMYGMQWAEQMFSGDAVDVDHGELDKLHWSMWYLSQPTSFINGDALKNPPTGEQHPWNSTHLNGNSTIAGSNLTTAATNSTSNGTASAGLSSSHPSTNLLAPYLTGGACNDPYLCEDESRKHISELLQSASKAINGTTWLGFMLTGGEASGQAGPKPTFPTWTTEPPCTGCPPPPDLGPQRPPPNWAPENIPDPPPNPNAPESPTQPVLPDEESPDGGPPKPSEEEKYQKEKERREKAQSEINEACKNSKDNKKCKEKEWEKKDDEQKAELEREREDQRKAEEKNRLEREDRETNEKCAGSKDKERCKSKEQERLDKERKKDEQWAKEEREKAEKERSEEEERTARERKEVDDKCKNFQDQQKCIDDEQRKMDDQRRVDEERKAAEEQKKQADEKAAEACRQSQQREECERKVRQKNDEERKAQDERNRLAEEERAKARDKEIKGKCGDDKPCMVREKADDEARQKMDELERQAERTRGRLEREGIKPCLKKPCPADSGGPEPGPSQPRPGPFKPRPDPSRPEPDFHPNARFRSSHYDPEGGMMRAGDLVLNTQGVRGRYEEEGHGPPGAGKKRIDFLKAKGYSRFKVMKGKIDTKIREWHRMEDVIQMDDLDWVKANDHTFKLKNGQVATNSMGDPIIGGPPGSPPQEVRPVPRKKVQFSDETKITEYELFNQDGEKVKMGEDGKFKFRHNYEADRQLDWDRIVHGVNELQDFYTDLKVHYRYNPKTMPYSPPNVEPGKLPDNKLDPFEQRHPSRIDPKQWPPHGLDGTDDVDLLDKDGIRKLKNGELGKLPKTSAFPKNLKNVRTVTKIARFTQKASASLTAGGPVGWIVMFGTLGLSEFVMFSQAEGNADVWWHCAQERIKVWGVHTCGAVDENGNPVEGEDKGPWMNFLDNYYGWLIPSDIDGDGKMENPFEKFVAGMQDLGEAVYDFFDSSEDGTGVVENTVSFVENGFKTIVHVAQKGWQWVEEKAEKGWEKVKSWGHTLWGGIKKLFGHDDDD